MKIESQVCGLELAEKLQSLGVKQNAWWYWKKWDDGSKTLQQMMTSELGNTHPNSFSAFSVAELGEMLPDTIANNYPEAEHNLHRLVTEKQDKVWNVMYICFGCKGKLTTCTANTEADARAKMFVYLLENKLITL